MLIDTHCHLDGEQFESDRPQMLSRARDAGVWGFVLIGFNPERWRSCRELADREPDMWLAVGLHPTEAERFSDELEANLRAWAKKEKVVAIGETGLDYYWDSASPQAQRRAFERQIYLAKRLGLPFIVHQRQAAEDVLDVLQRCDPPHRGVMHCFTEDQSYAEQCIELGLHIGIGGAVTHLKAKGVHETAASIPLERLLLETDAPYMTPSPYRGQRNEPAYLCLIRDRVAELRDTSPEAIEQATSRNALELFKLTGLFERTKNVRGAGTE